MSFQSKFQRLLTVIVLLTMVFTAVGSVTTAEAANGGPRGANPVKVDGEEQTVASRAPWKMIREFDPDKTVRVMVRLEGEPLASYKGGMDGFAATSPKATGAAKLDVESAASRAYAGYLYKQQQAFVSRLNHTVSGATVDRSYNTAFNGLAIRVRQADLESVRKIAGVVSVTPEKRYDLDMDSSLPLIGLGTGTVGDPAWTDAGLWQTLGGHANAGKGIKVADIDSGITPSNPCFAGTGYAYPKGFPRGEKTVTNGKIIAAYSYFRADDPPVYPPSAIDDPADVEGGHGTHTAGTILCNYGTTTTYSGIKISGVAPKAQLMVYRVFYRSLSGSNSAYTPELVAAIEQAIKDGADVVNNSWGGSLIDTRDPETLAYEAASDAGMVVVFSAGNSGPSAMTIGAPGGNSEKFITVAASTTARTFTTTLSGISRSDAVAIDPTMENILGRSITQVPVEAEIVDLQVEGYSDTIACNPISLDLTGKIVVVRRGTCALVDKVAFAKDAGAVGVVIRNVAGGSTTLPLIAPVLPTIHINAANGDALYTYLSGVKTDGATAIFRINGPAVLDPTGDVADVVASFSSRGPTPNLHIKPDLAAPGVNILSSVSPLTEVDGSPEFDFYQGTSMAAPHVTGAAALLVQLKPTWSPAQIRSALMSSTKADVLSSDFPMDGGAGRLDLAAPDKVGVTFDMPSLSYGLMAVGGSQTLTVNITNVTAAPITYDVTVTPGVDSTADVVSPEAATVSIPAGATVDFDFALTTASAGDSYGQIYFADQAATSPTLHIPYFARADSAYVTGKNILLVDDDGSTDACGPDVRAAYTDALDALGLTYDVMDITNAGGFWINFDIAPLYDAVVYFSAPGCGGDLSFEDNELRTYLAGGGRMLVFGPDAADWNAYFANAYGVSFSSGLYFGNEFVQSDLFRDQTPLPAVAAEKRSDNLFLVGQLYDIPAPAGIDELVATEYSDTNSPSIMRANDNTSTLWLAGGSVGTRMSSEPTIERVKGTEAWTRLPYRTAFFSFGLDQISETNSKRTDLLGSMLDWLEAEVSVSFARSAYAGSIGRAVTFAATPGGRQYRWDFGDGSAVQTTSAASVSHLYKKLGTYKAYVQVMDEYGHTAVNSTTVFVVTPPVAPRILAPGSSTTDKTPDLAWGTVPGATQYYVELFSLADGRKVFSTIVSKTSPNCIATRCTVTAPTLMLGGYVMKVRAGNLDAWGALSAPRLFKVKKRIAL